MRKNRLFYIFVFLISALLIFLPLFNRSIFQEYRQFGLLGIFIINFLGTATIFIPNAAILSVGVGGAMYNPILVALVASLGSGFGESVGYLFGYTSREILNLKKHKIIYPLIEFIFKKYGTWIVLVFSFVPNPVFDGIGIIIGMSSFSLRKFLLLVFIGRLARNILVAFLGANL